MKGGSRMLQRWASAIGHYRAEMVLFMLAAALYTPGISWGLPWATGPDRISVWAIDDISPLRALTEVYNTISRRPVGDRWLAYPLCHHFVLTACYAPYLLTLKLTGQLGALSSVYPYGLEDPVTALQFLTVIARLVSIGMAAGTVVVAYRIGRTLWDTKTATIAALITLVPYPVFYYSKTANLEVPLLFWSSLGLLSYAQILAEGISLRRAAWLGVFAGLAAATKDHGAGLFLLLPLVLLPRHLTAWKAGSVSWWAPPLIILVAGSAVYALASGLALDPDRWWAHMHWGMTSSTDYTADVVTFYPLTVVGVTKYIGAVAGALLLSHGPLLLALAGVGVALTALRERPQLAFGLAAVSYLVTILLPIHYFRIRYGIPLAFISGIFAARGLTWALNQVARSRLATVSAVLVTLAWPLFLSADLVAQMRNDSRQEAGAWLEDHLPKGVCVAYFNRPYSLPRLPDDVVLLRLPGGLPSLQVLKDHRPDIVIVLPDYSSPPGGESSRACPAEVYQRLHDGSLGYWLEARFHYPSHVRWQMLDSPSVNPPVQIFVRNYPPPGAQIDPTETQLTR